MNNSRTINSFKNIVTGLSFQIITIILGFVNRSVFLYCLSVDYLGIQGLFSDILNMLSLADLGFSTVMIYSLYEPLAKNDHKKIAALISFYKKVYLAIAAFFSVVGVALIPFLKYLVNFENEIPHLQMYYVLYLANMISSYLVVYKTNILEADQKGYIIQKYSIIFSIAQSVCMMIFLLLTKNYIVYLVVQVGFTYIKNLFISFKAEKTYPFIKQKEALKKEEKIVVVKNVGSAFLYKVSGVLINATDNTLISVLVNTSMVGYYSNYSLVVTRLTALINSVFYSMTASLGNLVVTEDEEKRFKLFKTLQTISAILSSFCTVCLMYLIQDFIQIWLGKEYQLDKFVLSAIIVNFFLSISLLPIWVYRDATGLYRKTRYIMLICAFLNILYSVILGKICGLAGILIATSLSRISTYFWYEPRLLFKQYFGKSCKIYFKFLLNNIVITAFLIVVVNFTSNRIYVDGMLTFIVKLILTVLVSGIVLLLFYHKDSGLKIIINRIKSIIKK